MKIIFTGSSSFTGFHFINELKKNNNDVYVTFSKNKSYYLNGKNNRSIRVKKLINENNCYFNVNFSKPSGLNFIKNKIKKVDVFCHHFANTSNYKSENYDLLNSLKNSTEYIEKIMKLLKQKGLKKYVYTGSYFEPSEQYKKTYKSFSKYGLSKLLIGEIINHYCYDNLINYGKFVIPNPFGEYEDENRLSTILIKTWKSKKQFTINTPAYIRDNIPIFILAREYSKFINLSNRKVLIAPSFYRTSNLEFVIKLSKEIKKRTKLACNFSINNNPTYLEPMKMINKDKVSFKYNDKKIEKIWNKIIDYYKTILN